MNRRLFQAAYSACVVVATLGWIWLLADAAQWLLGY